MQSELPDFELPNQIHLFIRHTQTLSLSHTHTSETGIPCIYWTECELC